MARCLIPIYFGSQIFPYVGSQVRSYLGIFKKVNGEPKQVRLLQKLQGFVQICLISQETSRYERDPKGSIFKNEQLKKKKKKKNKQLEQNSKKLKNQTKTKKQKTKSMYYHTSFWSLSVSNLCFFGSLSILFSGPPNLTNQLPFRHLQFLQGFARGFPTLHLESQIFRPNFPANSTSSSRCQRHLVLVCWVEVKGPFGKAPLLQLLQRTARDEGGRFAPGVKKVVIKWSTSYR